MMMVSVAVTVISPMRFGTARHCQTDRHREHDSNRE
jgi:hypothetical protein